MDPSDVTELVQRHQAEVWRYLRFLGATPELADDLCQEAFLQLLRAPFTDQGDRARAGWLRTVARNLLIKSYRKPPFPTADIDEIEAAWQQFAQDDSGDETLAQLRHCRQLLDGRAAVAVRLHYEERRSRRDIAKQLGIGEHGVKSLLRRSREVLRRCVEDARRQA